MIAPLCVVSFPVSSRRLLALLHASALACVACGTTEAPLDEDPEEPEPTAAKADSGAGKSGGPLQQCSPTTFSNEGEARDFESLSAQVVDLQGEPVTDTMAQACGADLCLFGRTDSSGNVEIAGARQSIRDLAFKYGDGLKFAQFALRLPDGPQHVLGPQRTVRLPPTSEAATLEAGEVRAGAFRLTLAEDVEIKLNRLDYGDADGFLAVGIPMDSAPEVIAREEGLVAAFALGPAKTRFCPPAQLRLPNSAELPAGAEVELLLHNPDVAGQWAPYAGWEVAARGRVAEDGGSITTSEDEGIGVLGVWGVREVRP